MRSCVTRPLVFLAKARLLACLCGCVCVACLVWMEWKDSWWGLWWWWWWWWLFTTTASCVYDACTEAIVNGSRSLREHHCTSDELKLYTRSGGHHPKPFRYEDLVPTNAIQCLVGVRCTWCMELQLISHRMIANGKDNAEVIFWWVDWGKKVREAGPVSGCSNNLVKRIGGGLHRARELPSYMSRCIGSFPIPDGHGVRHRGLQIVKELGGHETELAFPGVKKIK